MHTVSGKQDFRQRGWRDDTVKIRSARVSDAEDVYQLVEEYYESIGVVVRDDRATLTHYLMDPGSCIWLAYAGADPVGCVVLRPIPSMRGASEVKRLYVKPALRRQGIAEKLMEALEIHARRTDVEWLYLDTKDDLADAIRFYERRGFHRCSRYNDNPQATIFMRKKM